MGWISLLMHSRIKACLEKMCRRFLYEYWLREVVEHYFIYCLDRLVNSLQNFCLVYFAILEKADMFHMVLGNVNIVIICWLTVAQILCL